MKAAVLYEYNQPLVVEDVELDPPKAREVMVKIGATGICRSDLHFMKGEAIAKLPIVLGHEAAGTVEQVGEGVTSVKAGDRVVLSFVSTCGRCDACTTGHPNMCEMRAKYSASQFDGTSRLHKGGRASPSSLKWPPSPSTRWYRKRPASRPPTTFPWRRRRSSGARSRPVSGR